MGISQIVQKILRHTEHLKKILGFLFCILTSFKIQCEFSQFLKMHVLHFLLVFTEKTPLKRTTGHDLAHVQRLPSIDVDEVEEQVEFILVEVDARRSVNLQGTSRSTEQV